MKKSNNAFFKMFLLLCLIYIPIGITFAAPVVESVAISGDKLIVTGHKFLDIDGLILSDPQTGFKKPFKVESATESEIVGTAVDNQKITVASLMNLIIDTAKGETTYPVSFSLQKDAVTNPTIKNGAITPDKFLGVTTANPPDQTVPTWSQATNSFVFTKASAGGGTSGVSQIVLGPGITGAPNTASGSVPVSVDIGNTGDALKTKIPYFNSTNKIILDSTNSPTGALSGLSFKDGTINFDIINDNGLRIDSEAAKDLLVLDSDGNLALKGPVTVGGYEVCLKNGNCIPSNLTLVTATAPLVAAKTSTGTTNISAGAVNTANNLVQLDSTGKFPANIPGVVRGPGSAARSATQGNLAIFSDTTGEKLGDGGIGLQNIVSMTATPTSANKIVISTGTNKILGTTSYTIPNTSGVTGQVLGITATNTASWIDSSGVDSFNSRTGAVTSLDGDYTASQVTNLPFGIITALNVQQAIDQLADLDSQKLPLSGGTMRGTIITTTQNAISVGPYATGTGEIRFFEHSTVEPYYVGFKAPMNIDSPTVWTLPAADGSSGAVLSTNGSKQLAWTSGGTGGIGNVVGPAISTLNNFAAFLDGAGKIIKDSGINSANLPTMAIAATAANKIIISSGASKQLSTTLYPIPAAIGASGTVLKSDGTNVTWQSDNAGTGDVVGPATSTMDAISAFAGTDGKTLKNTAFSITGNDLLGPNVFMGVNDFFAPSTVGCFSHSNNKDSNIASGYCQDLNGGITVSGGNNTMYFKVGGAIIFMVGRTTTTNQSNFVSTGNFTVNTDTFFVQNAADKKLKRVGVGTTTPIHKFQIDSIDSGFLPPRMTTAQKNAIDPQTPGLVVFDSDLNSLNVRNSTGWASLGSGTGNVVGPATSTLNNFATFSDGAGKIIKDSGVNSGNLPTMATAATAANKIIISAGANKQLTTTLYPIQAAIGASGTVLKSDGTNATWQSDNAGTGVAGPALSTINAIAKYSNTTGNTILNSSVLIDNSNNVSGVKNFTSVGALNNTGSMANTGSFSNTGAFTNYGTFTNTADIIVGENAIYLDSWNKRIGIGTTTPNGSAILDLTSTSKGLLLSRMTSAQRDAIVSPANGLMIYNSTTNSFDGRAGGAWKPVGAAPTVNNQTGTTYTMTSSDCGSNVSLNNASAITVSVPALAPGCEIDLVQTGAGQVTVSGSGITVGNSFGLFKTRAQYSVVTVKMMSASLAVLIGDLN